MVIHVGNVGALSFFTQKANTLYSCQVTTAEKLPCKAEFLQDRKKKNAPNFDHNFVCLKEIWLKFQNFKRDQLLDACSSIYQAV